MLLEDSFSTQVSKLEKARGLENVTEAGLENVTEASNIVQMYLSLG